MSQHLIDESRVLYPVHGQRPDAPSGRQDEEQDDGPGAMRRPEAREATVSEVALSGPQLATDGPVAEVKDASLVALDALSEALARMSEDQRLLEARLQDLRRLRASGMPWREILVSEEQPGSMQIVSRMLARLAKASGTLRKELVETLRREGVSIPAIARMFGVTHQRVSNLLRRPPD